jgi:hypothetical protein
MILAKSFMVCCSLLLFSFQRPHTDAKMSALPAAELPKLLRYHARAQNLPLMAELALFRSGEFLSEEDINTEVCRLVSLYPADAQVPRWPALLVRAVLTMGAAVCAEGVRAPVHGPGHAQQAAAVH